jgi:hypothetical protein
MYHDVIRFQNPFRQSDVNGAPGEPLEETAHFEATKLDERSVDQGHTNGTGTKRARRCRPRLALEPVMGRNTRVAMYEWRITGSRM